MPKNKPAPSAASSAFMILLISACAHHNTSQGALATTPIKSAAITDGPVKALPPRQDLPLVLRETLHTSMNRHGEELTFLLADVVLLQYEEAVELAEMLANEPRLGRPSPGDTDSLNAMLPESFFAYQTQMGERAARVAKAARARDDAGLVKAFGALAETCVGCHSSYLNDPLNAVPDHDEEGASE